MYNFFICSYDHQIEVLCLKVLAVYRNVFFYVKPVAALIWQQCITSFYVKCGKLSIKFDIYMYVYIYICL